MWQDPLSRVTARTMSESAGCFRAYQTIRCFALFSSRLDPPLLSFPLLRVAGFPAVLLLLSRPLGECSFLASRASDDRSFATFASQPSPSLTRNMKHPAKCVTRSQHRREVVVVCTRLYSAQCAYTYAR